MAEIGIADAPPRSRVWDTLRLVASSGGPGRCEFALNNACNANCGFCNFARDTLPKERWEYVDRQGVFDAIDILFRQGIRYLVLTGGEPTLHHDLTDIIRHASGKGIKVMLVSNGGLFSAADRLVRDGCTRCMIDCYRDASTMQHIAVSAHRGAIAAFGRLCGRGEGARSQGQWRIDSCRGRGIALAHAILSDQH
jgi:hypothetical protein